MLLNGNPIFTDVSVTLNALTLPDAGKTFGMV